MHKSAFTIREDKMNVQEYYVQIIFESLKKIGYTCKTYNSISEARIESKKSLYVSISHYYSVRMYMCGYNNQIYWIQGSSPDESFMRNHSYIRKIIVSCIEYYALTRAKYVFMVSEGMLKHYKMKYKKDYSYKTYVMPCYNSTIQKGLFFTPKKYEKNTFCYVGGLSVWQCFPETVQLYRRLEENIPNAMLKIYTGDQERAKAIIESYGVKNYEIKYVKPDLIEDELADCKYGFIVRNESLVNYVATPTKLSNYMAAGLIPIVSNTVSFFREIFKNTKFAVVLDGNNDIEKINQIANNKISAEAVLAEYQSLFDKFYNTELHINNIAVALKNKGL